MLIAVENLRHRFGDRMVLALDLWTVADGQHCLVHGPSGSGKTTLFNVLAGLIRPAEGKVAVADQDLADLGSSALDRFRGRTIGIVFQTLHLVRALNVLDNLRLTRYLAGLGQDERRIEAVLGALDIAGRAKAKPRTLSQGEAQRVAIARAVVTEPRLILADEPTSALDDRSCGRVVDLLFEQAQACGATLVVATHDARLKERFAQRLELGSAA